MLAGTGRGSRLCMFGSPNQQTRRGEREGGREMTLEKKLKSTRSVKAVLKDARSVLSSVAVRPCSTGSGSGREIYQHCVELVEEFHRLLKSGAASFEFQDWTVLKAVVEVVVRWGIYPYLSPGVGIPLQKRFGAKAASAAASAVSDYLHGAGTEAKSEAELSGDNSEAHALVLSADLLSFIVLEEIVINPNDKPQADTAQISGDAEKKEEKEDGAAEDEKYEGQYTPAVVSSPGALRQRVLSHHLIDILAALLQIAHDEQFCISLWKEEAVERIRVILARLPVDYVVEALFTLLGQEGSITPPSWLKPEVGKLLSQFIVIRSGALATVMERLAGGAESGSVYVYERVAAHLAKVPRHACKKDEYYKAVCSELRMLLFLPDISCINSYTSKAHKNMHHTSIILACVLVHQEPALTEKYLLRPIVDPLLSWNGLRAAEGENSTNRLPENSLLAGLHVLKLLLTAGHDKSAKLRELLVRLTSPLVPKLILLEYLLWPSYRKHAAPRFGGSESGAGSRVSSVDNGPQKNVQKGGQRKEGLKVGFLEGQRLYNVDEDEEKCKGTVGHLMDCITEIVGCHLTQPALHVVPMVLTFLLELNTASLIWPSDQGQIADAIEAGKGQADSPAMYLSKLLLTGEYWELSLALLDTLLRRVLGVRKAARIWSATTSPDQMMERTVNLLETLEVLCTEVGLKAVENDATQALPLLKILLDDNDILTDGEMVELVLRLLYSAVSQLHEDQKGVEDDENLSVLKRGEQIELLTTVGLSLEKITVSSGVPKKAKEFAASVRSTISQHLSDISRRP